MAQQSTIEWTEVTWNPTTGCDKISAGCKFCYAEVMAKRLKAMGKEKYRNAFKLTLHPESVDDTRRWKKPKTIFVNSMSDLFHKKVPLPFIKDVFKVMNETPHTYQVLTKRADLLLSYNRELNWTPNIWMGVSVEDERVVARIDHLRQTDAALKFLSLEPLIGPLRNLNLEGIHWVIVGGESGHGARPIKAEWLKDIQRQCRDADVKFFFKQWGKPEFNPDQNDPTIDSAHEQHAKGGCQLVGKVYHDMPERINSIITKTN